MTEEQQSPGAADPPGDTEGAGATKTGPENGTTSSPVEQAWSVSDIISHPTTQEYVKYVSIGYASIGLGVGIAVILFGMFAEPLFFDSDLSIQLAEGGENTDQFQQFIDTQYLTALGSFFLYALMAINVSLGTVVGGYIAKRLEEFRLSAIVGGLSSFVGTVVGLILAGSLVSTQISPPPEEFMTQLETIDPVTFLLLSGNPVLGYSFNFGNLIVSSILVGAGSALAAIGVSYLVVNMDEPPTEFDAMAGVTTEDR